MNLVTFNKSLPNISNNHNKIMIHCICIDIHSFNMRSQLIIIHAADFRWKHNRALLYVQGREALHGFVLFFFSKFRKMVSYIIFRRDWGGKDHNNEHPQSIMTSLMLGSLYSVKGHECNSKKDQRPPI